MDAKNKRNAVNEPIKMNEKSGYAVISFILSLAPIAFLLAVFLLLMIASSNDIFAGTWPVFIILVLIFAVVATISTILSVIFGIIGLIKSNKRTLFSWAGIIVASVEVWVCLLLMLME